MAFGHAVKRGGFDQRIENDNALILGGDGDDQIKGGDSRNVIDGGEGDDVIIAKGGNDVAIGGDGEDDLSGGEGNDSLTGAIWNDDGDQVPERDEFEQDAFSDDFNAEATFEENGTDTIFYYDADTGGANDDTGGTEDDGIYDVVDFSDTIDFVDPTPLDGQPITTAEKEAQLDADLSYDDTTGDLSYQGDVFFKVFEDAVGTAADTVYVEVDGDQFVYDTANDDWDLVA